MWIQLRELSHNILGSGFAAVTFHAPAHVHRGKLYDAVHFSYIAMTNFTRDALCNVTLVRKINKIRKLVHTDLGKPL